MFLEYLYWFESWAFPIILVGVGVGSVLLIRRRMAKNLILLREFAKTGKTRSDPAVPGAILDGHYPGPTLPKPGERWRKLPCDRHPTLIEVFDVIQEGPWSPELEEAADCGCLVRAGAPNATNESFESVLKATVAEAKEMAKEAALYAEQTLARRTLDGEHEARLLREASGDVGKTYDETLSRLLREAPKPKAAPSGKMIVGMTPQEIESLAGQMEEHLKSQGKLSGTLLGNREAMNAEETLFRQKLFGGVTHTPTGLIWPKMPVMRKALPASSIERALESYIEKNPDKVAGILDRAGRGRPQEFAFPDYMAAIDPLACTSVPTRFLRKLLEESTVDVEPSHAVQVDALTCQHLCAVTQAVLFVRPYVIPRVEPSRWSDWLHEWSGCKLRIETGGEIIETALEEHLVAPDGLGLRKKPYAFYPGWPGSGMRAAAYDAETASPNPGGVPFPFLDLGIVLTSQDLVMLRLTDIPSRAPKQVFRVGALLGVYTTQALGGA